MFALPWRQLKMTKYQTAGSVENEKPEYSVLLPTGSYKPIPAKRSALSKDDGTYEIYENNNADNDCPDPNENGSKWKQRFIISTSVLSSALVLIIITFIVIYCLKIGEKGELVLF